MAPYLFVLAPSETNLVGVVTGQKVVLFSVICTERSSKAVVLNCDDVFPTNNSSEQPGKTRVAFSAVVSCAVSKCGNYAAASDSNKELYLWKKTENGNWNPLSSRTLSRKCYKLTFTNSASDLIVADRSGDVFRFSVGDPFGQGRLILGHISIILDMCITSDDKYLLTCDRDAKIRVSMYPNCYNIHAYCLGHEEFVSSMCVFDAARHALSGSGDGTLKLWDYTKGNLLLDCRLRDIPTIMELVKTSRCSVNAEETGGNNPRIAVRSVKHCAATNTVAVLLSLLPSIAIFKFSDDSQPKLEFKQCLQFEHEPLDVHFDALGHLWVFTLAKENCVRLFKTSSDGDVFMVEVDDKPEALIAKELSNNCDSSFISSFDKDLSNLYKNAFDSYMTGEKCKNEPVEEPVKKNKLE